MTNDTHTHDICPVCDEGTLSSPIAFQKCDTCGSDVAGTDLVKLNHMFFRAEQQRDELRDAANEYIGTRSIASLQRLQDAIAKAGAR